MKKGIVAIVLAVLSSIIFAGSALAWTIDFRFSIIPEAVQVDQSTSVSWAWNNSAESLVFTTTVPAGVWINWNDECRMGAGCTITHTMYKNSSGGQGVVTNAKALQPGIFRITTEYLDSDGEGGHLEALLSAGNFSYLPIIIR